MWINICNLIWLIENSFAIFVDTFNKYKKMEDLKEVKPTTIKGRMYSQIEKHGEDLNRIFKTEFTSIELCKKLHRLEVKATRFTTALCNGDGDVQENERELNKILVRVQSLLCSYADVELRNAIFVNGDPRGYALKISDKYVREHGLKIYTDFGGYGILSPEFNGR